MIVDGAILFFLFLFAFRSYRERLSGEIAGAGGWILTILLAFALTDIAAAILNQFFKSSDLKTISSYLAFLLVLVGVRALLMWAAQILPSDKSGLIANGIPILFGLFKGAFFISVFLLMISSTTLQSRIKSYGSGAVIYPRIINFAPLVVRSIIHTVPNVDSMMRRLGSPANPQPPGAK